MTEDEQGKKEPLTAVHQFKSLMNLQGLSNVEVQDLQYLPKSNFPLGIYDKASLLNKMASELYAAGATAIPQDQAQLVSEYLKLLENKEVHWDGLAKEIKVEQVPWQYQGKTLTEESYETWHFLSRGANTSDRPGRDIRVGFAVPASLSAKIDQALKQSDYKDWKQLCINLFPQWLTTDAQQTDHVIIEKAKEGVSVCDLRPIFHGKPLIETKYFYKE